MPLTAKPVPAGLADKLAERYGCRVSEIETVLVDYRSELKPLWNGTVYICKLTRKAWPQQVYVFSMPAADGVEKWQVRTHGPNKYPSAEEAVKAAYRERSS